MTLIILLRAIALPLLLLPSLHLADNSSESHWSLKVENQTQTAFSEVIDLSTSSSVTDLKGSDTDKAKEVPLVLSSASRIVGPYFETNQSPISISASAGNNVMLDCPVALLQGRTVSWLRKKGESVQLLTVGNTTYSTDSRHGLFFRYPNNWRLGIANVCKLDEGTYECQLSTHPTKALVFHLSVIAPDVQILDDNEHMITERHYKVGSSLHLICRASSQDNGEESPTWFKGDRLLPGGGSRIKVKSWTNHQNGETSSFLSIPSVRQLDSGTYSCRTSLASNTVIVHVLNDELPAAVQHENAASRHGLAHRFPLALLSILISL